VPRFLVGECGEARKRRRRRHHPFPGDSRLAAFDRHGARRAGGIAARIVDRGRDQIRHQARLAGGAAVSIHAITNATAAAKGMERCRPYSSPSVNRDGVPTRSLRASSTTCNATPCGLRTAHAFLRKQVPVESKDQRSAVPRRDPQRPLSLLRAHSTARHLTYGDECSHLIRKLRSHLECKSPPCPACQHTRQSVVLAALF
jgi:hypothetical protein